MVGLALLLCGLFTISSASEKKLNSTELLANYDLPSESHLVTTSDGYIINIFRVPRPGAFPVLIMPGFISSSNTWIVGPKEQSIVNALAEDGYDVWLLNYRGSYYGKKHVSLDPVKNPKKFWDFTFHEIGTLDIPAILEYVENETGIKQVLYVGHSMGTLSLYVMCVERPDLCPKVRAAGLLAPVIFPPDSRDRSLISTGMTLLRSFAASARRMGLHEIFGNEEQRSRDIRRMCSIPVIGNSLCRLSFTGFAGSAKHVDENSLPSYIVNTLSGTSVKLGEHLVQLMTSSKRVPRFDYGWAGNQRKYRTRYSPSYNGTVPIPLIVFHSKSDPFTDQRAVNLLKKHANVVYDKFITDPSFNHVNFVFSNDLRKYIIDDLLKLFRSAVES